VEKKNDAYSIVVPGVDVYTKKEIGCGAHGSIVIPTEVTITLTYILHTSPEQTQNGIWIWKKGSKRQIR
jgi:hypothetical protein